VSAVLYDLCSVLILCVLCLALYLNPFNSFSV
jgi:hypothetical protein